MAPESGLCGLQRMLGSLLRKYSARFQLIRRRADRMRSRVLLEISVEAADAAGARFSDGNMAASTRRIYEHSSDLRELDWSIIKSRKRAMYAEWKLKRAADILLPGKCSPTFFKTVHVQEAILDDTGSSVQTVAKRIVAKSAFARIPVLMDLTRSGVRNTHVFGDRRSRDEFR